MHTDEAVHAVKAGILLDRGAYTYNPHEYHGPTLYYFSLPAIRLSGARQFREIPGEFPLRIVPVLFGTALVLLLLLMRDGLGSQETACAAVLAAVSPALVFYSRYYIQETLLVFFTFAAVVAAWRYTRVKKLAWALAAGVALGLMHATKETCVIAYGALLGGALLTVLWTRWIEGRRLRLGDYVHRWHAAGALKAGAVVSLFLLTAFLSNPAATLDAVRTYGFYLSRAGSGEGGPGIHQHPWHYYLRMLVFFRSGPGPWWSEGMIVALAVAGIVEALRRRTTSGANVYLIRFLAFYTILMTIVYSLIPYKTPWCLLGFLHAMILLAGVGAIAVYRRLPGRGLRILAGALFALGTVHLAVQAYRGSYVFDADTRNPYVYGHTSADLLNFVRRVDDLAEIHPEHRRMTIKVVCPDSDYWPLPWYLRRYENVGYWKEAPENSDAQVIVTKPAFEEMLDLRLRGKYKKEFFGLRPEVLMMVYIQESLWDAFIQSRE